MKAGYPYPIEALRHWYIAPIGGVSNDLEPGQIGVNREALADNTDLVPYQDRVSLSRLDGGLSRPLFAKKYFEVVPLDDRSPDALSKSMMGEAVLPVREAQRRGALETFKVGDLVVMNGVLSQRYPRASVEYGL
ncbi:MAG: hypothetical protein QUS08_06360 [Methanothrix sp.]|nr:hypothetical protein [Methanothrix sp.]